MNCAARYDETLYSFNPLKQISMAPHAKVPPPTSKAPSDLEDSINQFKQAFIKNLSAQGTAPFVPPKEIARLLAIFHTPGQAPSGLSAQIRQKILIVKSDDAHTANLQNGDPIEVSYGISSLNARVKRVSEYPNAPSEFNTPTETILIEWNAGPHFIDEVRSVKKGTQTITVMAQAVEADNFIINPRPPNSDPDPPVLSAFLRPGILAIPVAKSDFSAETYAIIDSTPPGTKDIKVVVSDTGLKFNLGNPPEQAYRTSDGHTTHLPIAGNPNSPSDPNRAGFCSLTNYMDDGYAVAPAAPAASFPGGIPTADDKILRNPHDDHAARHGTHVAAIVAQNPAGVSEIIPLKIFDFLGFGTLFDILCGFNYVFSRLEAGENIRLVNASWGAGLPGSNFSVYTLLEKKIAVLEDNHVFVIAAAGNRDSIDDSIGHDLSAQQLVPACYSELYDNVITVTSVAETWEKRLFNRAKRSHYLNQALHDKLLATGNWLERLLNLISNIVPKGYAAVENYSSRYVEVGVVAHPLGGFFPTPFGGTHQLPIAGSSFATAFMSAYVVRFLQANPSASRAEILNSLPTHASLRDHVQQGRYLELDTVTGRSIEDNFDSVLRAILSSPS
jgi:hypothetical protein